MNIKWTVLFLILFLSSCAHESYTCRSMSNETHNKAFMYQLNLDGIDYKVNENGLICLPTEMWDGESFSKLDNQVSTYYRGVAELLITQADVKKVALWLETENIPHDFSVSSKGTLLVIYSASPNEAKENREKMYSVLKND